VDIFTTLNGSGGHHPLLSQEEFLTQLGPLAERWQAHCGQGLEIRHETGKLLNGRYGDPARRQTRGEGTLKEAADRLQVAESELSRMRRFAYHFRTLEDLRREYPEAGNWTAVKKILPALRAKGPRREDNPGGVEESPRPGKAPRRRANKPAKAVRRRLRKMKRALRDLFSVLPLVREGLGEEQRQALLEQFRRLAGVVTGRPLIQESVGQVREGVVPTAGELMSSGATLSA